MTKTFLKFDSDVVNFKAGAGEGSIEIHAKKHDDDEKKLASFTIKAYNGGAMFVDGFSLPIVLDLAGMKVTSKSRPILLNHNPETPVGHSTEVNIGARNVVVKGVFSVRNERTDEMIAASKDGFPWQASVGASVDAIEFIDEGERGEANGRSFKGPVLISRKSELMETSFLPLGADDSTSVKIAASKSAEIGMEKSMFEKWLKAQGLDITTLDEGAIKALRGTFKGIEASRVKEEEVEAQAAKDKEKKKKTITADAGNPEDKIQAAIDKGIEKISTRLEQQGEIARIAANYPDILKEAREKDWTADKVSDRVALAAIQAGRPKSNFGINTGAGASLNVSALTAAAMQSCGMKEDEIIKSCSQEALEVGHKTFRGRLGLQELFFAAAQLNGYVGANSMKQDMSGVFEAAMRIQAAHSNISLPGILSNVANKSFVDAFNHVESTWQEVSAIGSVTDFKQTSRFSLTSDMKYKLVGPGGQITHAEVGEESYINQADTYARLYSIDRTTLINDDLGSLNTIPAQLGKGAADAFNEIFWTEFLENAEPFYSSGNKNLSTGPALSIDELTAMELLFFDQQKPNGTPYGAMPEILLVPNALWVLAQQITRQTTIVLDGSSSPTKITNDNPHAGKFMPVRSSFLNNSAIPGASATHSFLLSRPVNGGLSVIESVFLNGQQTPTIETGDVDFSLLGIQFRGFHDFGINKQEFREGVKSNGV